MIKFLILIITFCFYQTNYAQEIKFKNPYFEKVVLENYPEIDKNLNGKIEFGEAEKIEKLSLMKLNIKDADDIIYFKGLRYLSLTINEISSFKIDGFMKLEELYIARNILTRIEISNLPSLKTFACGLNHLTEVKIINCPNIESLNLMDNQIEKVDLKQFNKLKYLTIDNNKLNELDISNNVNLIQIVIKNNQIKTIDISKNINLKMNTLYIDKSVKIIGKEEQLMLYKPVVEIISGK